MGRRRVRTKEISLMNFNHWINTNILFYNTAKEENSRQEIRRGIEKYSKINGYPSRDSIRESHPF